MRRPFFITADRRVKAEVRADQGTPLLKTVLIVVVRKLVRLYKFFRLPRHELNILPSCAVAAMKSSASSRISVSPPRKQLS